MTPIGERLEIAGTKRDDRRLLSGKWWKEADVCMESLVNQYESGHARADLTGSEIQTGAASWGSQPSSSRAWLRSQNRRGFPETP